MRRKASGVRIQELVGGILQSSLILRWVDSAWLTVTLYRLEKELLHTPITEGEEC